MPASRTTGRRTESLTIGELSGASKGEHWLDAAGHTPHRSRSIAPAGRDVPTRKERNMNTLRIVAIALIVAGALGLLYGGFSYTKDTTALKLGPLELSVKEKQTVNVPLWAGVGAIVVGGLLLVVGGRKG